MTSLLSALTGDPEIETLLGDDAQLAAMVAFESALAQASGEVGFIPAEAAQVIVADLQDYQPDWDDLKAGMARDGVPVPAFVKQLQSHVSADVKGQVHKGATSQDVVDTALMLQVSRVFDVYDARLNLVIGALERLQAENGEKAFVAHTRMQVALPSTWNAKIASWIGPLVRAQKSLNALRRSLLVIQLGGPVGDRGSFGEYGDKIAALMAKSLDLGLAEPWQAQRDQIIALGAVLVQISGALGKLGLDVALLAQNEVGVVRLAGGGTSSAMAHKSNPVKAEVLVALAHSVAGQAGTLNLAMVHENERSGMAWTLEWLTLPGMLIGTGASLGLAQGLLEQLQIQ